MWSNRNMRSDQRIVASHSWWKLDNSFELLPTLSWSSVRRGDSGEGGGSRSNDLFGDLMLIARPIYYFIQIPSFASQSCLNQVFLSLSPVTNVLKFDRYDSYIASHSKILIDNADLRISRSSRTLSALTKSKLSGIFELFSKSFRRTIETDPTTKHKTRQSSEPLRTKKRFTYI